MPITVFSRQSRHWRLLSTSSKMKSSESLELICGRMLRWLPLRFLRIPMSSPIASQLVVRTARLSAPASAPTQTSALPMVQTRVVISHLTTSRRMDWLISCMIILDSMLMELSRSWVHTLWEELCLKIVVLTGAVVGPMTCLLLVSSCASPNDSMPF